MPRYEILPGFPASGPLPIPFAAGEGVAWGGHSEGFVVRFHPSAGNTWMGNFQAGVGGWQGVLEHPNGKHLIVISQGRGYVVDPEVQQVPSRLPGVIQDRIHHVVCLPELGAIVLCDGWRFEAITKDGLWWQSPRVSWDEIRNIKVDGTVLRAESSTPTAHGDEWDPFALDLTTGHCADSAYIDQMRRAIRLR